jgi:PHD/YefM family antitoxin component YafN of YafNO toxin-antitoxin module
MLQLAEAVMIDVAKDIDSLTSFKRRTAAFLKRLKKSGHPLVLTVNGKAELIVQDAASYQRLLDLEDRLAAIEGIRRGLDDVARGRTRAIDKVRQEKKRKYGL